MINSNVNYSPITIYSKFLSMGICIFSTVELHTCIHRKKHRQRWSKHVTYILRNVIYYSRYFYLQKNWRHCLMLTHQNVFIILISSLFFGRSSGNMYAQLQFWIFFISIVCIVFLLIMVRFKNNRYCIITYIIKSKR